MSELNCKTECCDCNNKCNQVDIATLKPCPFCGKLQVELVDCSYDDPCYSIQCRSCNTTVYSEESFIKAVKIWEGRTVSKPELTARELLEKIKAMNVDTYHQGESIFAIGKIRSILRGENVSIDEIIKKVEGI